VFAAGVSPAKTFTGGFLCAIIGLVDIPLPFPKTPSLLKTSGGVFPSPENFSRMVTSAPSTTARLGGHRFLASSWSRITSAIAASISTP